MKKRRSRRPYVKALLFCALLTSIITASPASEPDPSSDQDNADRFAAVKKWNGYITYHQESVTQGEYKCAGTGHHDDKEWYFGHMEDRRTDRASASVTLEQTQDIVWNKATGTLNSSCVATGNASTEKCTHSSYQAGSGSTKTTNARLRIDRFHGTYSFDVNANEHAEYTINSTGTDRRRYYEVELGESSGRPDRAKSITPKWDGGSQPINYKVPFKDLHGSQKLPSHGFTLSGSKTYPSEGESVPGNKGFQTTYVTTWVFTPEDMADVEMVVTVGGYEKWAPEGSDDPDKRGNGVTVYARLQDPDGTPTDVRAKKITFKLLGVSKEPGVCLNWPPKGQVDRNNEKHDLRIEKDENPELQIVGDDGQSASTKPGSYESADAEISSFDWGAYGDVMVTAEVEGKGDIVGFLKDDKGEHRTIRQIPIPKREDTSLIADAWKKDIGMEGKTDDEDKDDTPHAGGVCASHQGDGLSLYEEYRGFYVEGYFSKKDTKSQAKTAPGGLIHIRTDPTVKNFFVLNRTKADIDESLEGLSEISNLEVAKLREGGMSDDRIVNFHAGSAPQTVKQHGIWIELAPATVQSECAGAPIQNKTSSTINGPGSPAVIEKIVIPPIVLGAIGIQAESGMSDQAESLVHELLHACNVYHHGVDSHGYKHWYKDSYSGRTTVYEQLVDDCLEPILVGYPIIVKRESGVQVNPFIFEPKKLVYVGSKGGEHSGHADCIMRYTESTAYRDPNNGNARYYVPEGEKVKLFLCDQSLGTGVNAPDHQPHSRYGNATIGNCKSQICVNDSYAYEHKNKYDPSAP